MPGKGDGIAQSSGRGVAAAVALGHHSLFHLFFARSAKAPFGGDRRGLSRIRVERRDEGLYTLFLFDLVRSTSA